MRTPKLAGVVMTGTAVACAALHFTPTKPEMRQASSYEHHKPLASEAQPQFGTDDGVNTVDVRQPQEQGIDSAHSAVRIQKSPVHGGSLPPGSVKFSYHDTPRQHRTYGQSGLNFYPSGTRATKQ